MKTFITWTIASTLLGISCSAIADATSDTIALVKNVKTDCFNCHQVDKKIVGPAWKDVAARYKGDPTAQAALVDKVIKGGKGHWDKETGGLPMTPHPLTPSKEEIQQIIAAILQIQ